MSFIKFEGFVGVGRPIAQHQTLTLGLSGILGISRGASERYRLENYKYAALYYDPDDQVIGIKPTNDKQAANCTLRTRRNGYGKEISCKLFLKHFNIARRDTHRYPLSWDEESEMLVATISDYQSAEALS